jgi:hypothetical protein
MISLAMEGIAHEGHRSVHLRFVAAGFSLREMPGTMAQIPAQPKGCGYRLRLRERHNRIGSRQSNRGAR